ncbi:MAG: alanyl-tRNA editing protein [Nanoarchaeota archaeon]
MTDALYMEDSYCRDFDATVVAVKDGRFVVLDRTAFYPKGGGQPHDTGMLTRDDGTSFQVVFVGKFDGEISHEVASEGLVVGDRVHGVIDWDRRYKLMRSHSAAHLFSATLEKEDGARVTGNQLELEKIRIDFSLDTYDQKRLEEAVDRTNEVIGRDLQVSVRFMPMEEARKDPSLFKLAMGFPYEIPTIRVVSIGDYDVEADGGTHVKSTKEIGRLVFVKSENKGKKNRRIYVSVESESSFMR